MSTSRRSTIVPTRDRANEKPKTVELEHRIARVELALKELIQTVGVNTKRNTAMQAQLDHVLAKLTGR